jgi:hypothetical protein
MQYQFYQAEQNRLARRAEENAQFMAEWSEEG